MFYNNPYPQIYQPYQQQIQQLQQQIQQAQPQPQTQQGSQNGGMFYFVNSQKEAEDWVVGAGQTVFFFERNNPVFYIKSVAQNGLSQPVEVYDYTQRIISENPITKDHVEYVTREEFDELKHELDSIMKGSDG